MSDDIQTIILDDFTNELKPDTDFPLIDDEAASSTPRSTRSPAAPRNGKPIWTADQIADYLNRTGGGFAGGFNDTPNPADRRHDLSVITFGFHTQPGRACRQRLCLCSSDGSCFGLQRIFQFRDFNNAQRAATREAMQSWDDVIAVIFQETSVNEADINFGNLASAPTTQAYAYLPTRLLTANPAINAQVRRASAATSGFR